MKKTIRFCMTAALALALAACSGGSDSQKKNDSSAESSISSSSQTAAQPDLAASDENTDQNSTDQQTSQIQPAESSSEQASDSFASSLEQAYAGLGGEVSPVEVSTSETGNAIYDFAVGSYGQDIQVSVVQAQNGNTAQMVYDANVALDQSFGYPVMNNWTDGSKTVTVIRNNMANENFVEALDNSTQTAIRVIDVLPEQLDVTLDALGSLGYPVNLD